MNPLDELSGESRVISDDEVIISLEERLRVQKQQLKLAVEALKEIEKSFDSRAHQIGTAGDALAEIEALND